MSICLLSICFEISNIILALKDDRLAAYSPKYSLVSSLESSQSLMAVIFAIRSPHPLAINLPGALDIMCKSAIISIGVSTLIEYGLLLPLSDTNGLEIPSWEAEVGM